MKRTKEEILRDAGLYQADSFDRYFADRVLDAMEEYAKECMPKWIDIELAPKDGTYILIFDPNTEDIYKAWWNRTMGDGCWNYEYRGYLPKPTLFQYMPKLPNKKLNPI